MREGKREIEREYFNENILERSSILMNQHAWGSVKWSRRV